MVVLTCYLFTELRRRVPEGGRCGTRMNGLEEAAEELEALLTRALNALEPLWTVVLVLIMFICSSAAAAAVS